MRNDLLVHVERVFPSMLFEVILSQREVILHGTAGEASLYIQIPKVPIDLVARRITLEDLFERSDGFESCAFGSKGRSRLQIGRCRFARHVPLDVQITDRIVDTAVGRTVNGKLFPLPNRRIILSAGRQQLSLLKDTTAVRRHTHALHERNNQTLTVPSHFV